MPCWCKLHRVWEKSSRGIILRVRLAPNSSSCRKNGFFVTPEGEEYLKINVISVPEKGKANKELIAYLAKSLKMAKNEFEIISGELDRYKKILVRTDSENAAAQISRWTEEA